MAKKFTVSRVGGTDGWAAFDWKGRQVTNERSEKWRAELDGHHWSHAPSLFKRLGFKSVKTGNNYQAWKARPFWGIDALIAKHSQTDYYAQVIVSYPERMGRGNVRMADNFPTRQKALEWVREFGNEYITLTDARFGHEFETIRNGAGTATCPSREAYHCA